MTTSTTSTVPTVPTVPKEIGTLFDAPMVYALLSRNKTQTRRPMRPDLDFAVADQGELWCKATITRVRREGRRLYEAGPVNYSYKTDKSKDGHQIVKRVFCPLGQPGGLLVPLCTWSVLAEYDGLKPTRLPAHVSVWNLFCGSDKPSCYGKLRPGRFMPLSLRDRLPRLRVAWIRAERVEDITNEDARAEGIPQTAGEAEAMGLIDLSKTPGHEWDNRTSAENFLDLWYKTYKTRVGWVFVAGVNLIENPHGYPML